MDIHHINVQEADFSPFADVGAPVGTPVPQARTAAEQSLPWAEVGIWECTAGKMERLIAEAEQMYFISVKGRFTPVGGEAIEIRAGDSLFLPAHTKGVWEIDETVRKSYAVFHNSAA